MYKLKYVFLKINFDEVKIILDDFNKAFEDFNYYYKTSIKKSLYNFKNLFKNLFNNRIKFLYEYIKSSKKYCCENIKRIKLN